MRWIVGSSEHIIIADDDGSIRGLLKRIVRRVFPTAVVLEAANGAEALELYTNYGADLVITDQMMPNMGGIELIGRLREQGAPVPVLLISALKPAAPKLQHLGLIVYIAKPFELQQIEAALRQLFPSPGPTASTGDEPELPQGSNCCVALASSDFMRANSFRFGTDLRDKAR